MNPEVSPSLHGVLLQAIGIVPLASLSFLLGRSIKRAVSVEDAGEDPRVAPELSEMIGAKAFAAVPLVAKDRVISIVVVDNKFTGRAITDEDLRFLMMFANQAGLAVETAMAYSNLERANRELKETQSRLIQSEKMAALGEMAASIAHEIKNPLTVIGGFAARLAKRLMGGDEARYAGIIRDEARRLEKILSEVLDFSREMKPNLSQYSLNDICEGTAAMYEEEFREKGIRLVMELTDEPVGVVADAQQIRQALINIISNSEQAMEKSGGKELYMRTRLDREGGRAVVEISDTGGGIPAEILENIFNPFFTTKVKGTGLGLAITNKIVKNHGGEVEVVNREGAGASFIIRLPFHETEQGGA